MSPSLLPTPLTPIVGRERELQELGRLMASSRLITLTGAGGSGKTRLAIEAVARFAAGDSPAWVDLAPLADGGLLTDHVSRALEVHGEGVSGATQALAHSLKTRSLLLVLDNCEHLVDACARLVEVLLKFCAPLKILATSREPLGLPGEKIWQVPPLSLPVADGRVTLEELEASDALRLFVERAREASPVFRLTEKNAAAVAAICRRLDGLPLALELAAARTRVLSPEQIAERLDDTFRLLTTGGRTSLPRQKTLRGAFDWSHDLLSEEQRILLRRLSVFVGGFSLDAVEKLAEDASDLGDGALDALAALVDRSLVQLEPESEPARYRLLEIVRQYSRERLKAAGEEDEFLRRHAAYYLELAEGWAPLLFAGTGDQRLMAEVDREHDNLRAVADWAMAKPGEVEVALRIGYALHWYWYFRGHLLEGWRRLESAVALAKKNPPGDPAVLARVLVCLGFFSVVRGEPQHERERVAEAVALLRTHGDAAELAYALAIQSAVESFADPQLSFRAAEEGLGLLEGRPDDLLKAFACHWHGVAALGRGDLAQARASSVRTVVIGHALGHAAAIAHATYFLALIDFNLGDAGGARRWLAECLRLHQQMDTRWGISQGLRLAGQIAAQAGDAERGLRVLGGAERMREELGNHLPPPEQTALDRVLAGLRSQLGKEKVMALMIEGARLELGELLALALAAPGEPAAKVPPPPAAPVPPSPAEAPPVRSPEPPPLLSPELLPAETLASSAAEAPAEPAQDFQPGALRVAALGSLQVEVAGTQALEALGSARTRELLVFLLLQPNGASKEEVGVALWPEASASQIRNSFHVTLHRLRGVLGHPEAIQVVNGRYAVDPAFVGFFDVPLFESGAKAALAAAKKGQGVAAELMAAVELYRGELLQGEPAGEWHLERRDRLQLLYLELLNAAGQQLCDAGRFAEASEIYRRFIIADDLAEDAYRRLMVSLEASGQAPEGLRVYKKLSQVLQKELDVEPEPASREIFERLQRSSRSR